MGSGGGSDHFCLRWNNFHSNIASSFVQLRDHEDFVDVTLACEGHTIKAHKVVLSACSPYFRNLLKQNPCQHPIIILRDVAFADVSALLSFVYQGEVYVSHDRLTAFLHTAELLHIKGLTDQHHHSTASTTHSGSISSTNKNTDNSGSKESIGGIAVSLQAPSSGGATVPIPQLIAAAPQQPQTPLQQGPLPAGRGVPCSPSPTRPQCSPSPPQPPQPFISLPLAYHHISPPPKKRRHQQQLTPVAPLTASSNVSPLSSTSSAPNTSSEVSLHSVSSPLRCTDNPQVPALTVPKQEVGAALLTAGSTLAAALTAPRGERMISSGGNDTPTSGGALLLPLMVEVKQEVPESPAYTDDTSNSLCASGGGEQEAVNLVLDGSSSSNSPACSILRQRIQGYQGSPDAPPPPVYSIPRTDDDDASMDDADSKEGAGMAPPTTAVAIMRRQQHMLGLAAAAAGMYSSSAVGTTSLGSGGGTSDLVQTAQPSQGSGGFLLPPSTTITPSSTHKALSCLMGEGGGSDAITLPHHLHLPSTITGLIITTTATTSNSSSSSTTSVPGGGVKLVGGRPRYAGPRNCPHCGDRFSTIASLKYHVNLVHSVSDQVPCFYCSKWFDIRTDLKKHLELAHNEHS